MSKNLYFLKARILGNKKKNSVILLLSTINLSSLLSASDFSYQVILKQKQKHSGSLFFFFSTGGYFSKNQKVSYKLNNTWPLELLLHDLIRGMFYIFIVSVFPNFTRLLLALAATLCLFLLCSWVPLTFYLFFNSAYSSTPICPNQWATFYSLFYPISL